MKNNMTIFRQHWPIGRAIFHTKNKDMVAWVNHSEHLTIRSLEKRGNVRAAVSRLQSFVSILQKQLKFSKHEKLGYLTLKPQNIGNKYFQYQKLKMMIKFSRYRPSGPNHYRASKISK